MDQIDVNRIIGLAESIIKVGIASITLRFSKDLARLDFAMQGVRVIIEVEYEAIDLAVENIRKLIGMAQAQNKLLTNVIKPSI